MINFSNQLSLEQRFPLKVFKEQVKNLSQEEALSFLLEVLRQMMIKDNLVKYLLKQA